MQILCMQEIFTGPYFCAEQTTRWYDSTEQIPDGPTTQLMQEAAKQHNMVIVVPIYEEAEHGRVLQHRRRDRRRRHVPRQVSQEPHPARSRPASGRSSTSSRATSAIRCSRRSTRRSASTSATTGIFRRARASSDSTARRSCSIRRRRLPDSQSICGSSSSRRTLSRTRYFVGAINRVGHEAPWNIGEFYGQSYFCDPRGKMLAEASRDQDRARHGGDRSRQDPRSAQRRGSSSAIAGQRPTRE